MKARKKPVIVDMIRFDFEEWKNYPERFPMVINRAFSPMAPFHPIIDTLEGDMKVSHGDYIIKGVQGEYYPCKPDIFEATYELIEE